MLTLGAKLEGLIRDYIILLRHERSLSPSIISFCLDAASHFYEMNNKEAH